MYQYSRKFNVLPDPVDQRDRKYTLKNTQIRAEVDLRKWSSPVKDQGTLGSCVSHSLTSCYELMMKKSSTENLVDLSRLFSYYHTRVIEKTVSQDAGVFYTRNALKAAANYGICDETLWPYNIEKFNQQPTPECYLDAFGRRINSYESVDSLQEAVEVLNDGIPMMFAIYVYESFLTLDSENSTISMPTAYEYNLGGHSVAALGYSIEDRKFLIKNSFGVNWGDNGYCWMPFDYFDNYVFDVWKFDLK